MSEEISQATEQETSWWSNFTNKALLVREGVHQAVAGIPAIPGYVADLADKGVELAGGDLYEGSAGSWIQKHTKAGIDIIDPLKWAGIKPEIKSESDQELVDNVEIGTDIGLALATLGLGSVKLLGTGGKLAGRSGKLAASAGDDFAKAGVKAATNSADDAAKATAKTGVLSKPMTTGRYLALAGGPAVIGTGALVYESQTQNLSEAFLTGTMSAYDYFKEDFPEFAENIKEFGLSSVSIWSDVASVPRNATVNILSNNMIENGQHESAAALRIGNYMFNLGFAADSMNIMHSDADNKGALIIDKISEEAEVNKDQIEAYLAANYNKIDMIPDSRIKTAIHEAFPDLASKAQEIQNTATTVAATAEEESGSWLSKAFAGSALGAAWESLTSAFNAIVSPIRKLFEYIAEKITDFVDNIVGQGNGNHLPGRDLAAMGSQAGVDMRGTSITMQGHGGTGPKDVGLTPPQQQQIASHPAPLAS